ncbi:MAG: DUF4282 domain-containing protein [Pseudomonadota bacterium]
MSGLVSRFTSFDKLIATTLVKILYWIGIVAILLGGVVGLVTGFAGGFGSGLAGLIMTPIGVLVGIIFWRFICEIYIVVFGMYDRLGNIEKSLSND